MNNYEKISKTEIGAIFTKKDLIKILELLGKCEYCAYAKNCHDYTSDKCNKGYTKFLNNESEENEYR